MRTGLVVAVAKDGRHRFSKQLVAEVAVIAGCGIEGDAHEGITVKHRSRVAADPTQPNLRQVHLIHSELFDELQAKGFQVGPPIWERISRRRASTSSRCQGTRC